MKRAYCGLLSALVLFVFLSTCASGPVPVQKKAEAPATQAAAEEEGTKRKKVVEEVQVVSKELTYYWDGVLASYRVYKYAEEGVQRLEELFYNSDDEIQERIVFKYENGNCRSMQTFNQAGDLQSYHTYLYDERNRRVEDAFFNARDELQTRQTYEYDAEGRKSRWNVYNSDNALLSYTLYLYEGDLNTRVENYSPSDRLLDYFANEFSPEGRLLRSTWCTGEGEVEETTEYRYENSFLTEETHFRKNGSVLRRVQYTNNEFGNPLEKIFLDGGGDIQERVTLEYITRTSIRYESVKE
jgi:YD repeat-containing protein